MASPSGSSAIHSSGEGAGRAIPAHGTPISRFRNLICCALAGVVFIRLRLTSSMILLADRSRPTDFGPAAAGVQHDYSRV